MAAASHCRANSSFAYVVAILSRSNNYLPTFREFLPSLDVVPAVNGHNQTETIEALLSSRLVFHNLSRRVRKWGKLATFLTKYQLLERQVRTGTRYQVMLEHDLILKPGFTALVQSACERLETRTPRPHIVQLSMYGEILLTSLDGAKYMVAKLRELGIRKNDDQQLLGRKYFEVTRHRNYLRQPADARPVALARKTNAGDITSSRGMTWTEMALLRMLTSPAARALPNFGNPPDVEAVDGCCSCASGKPSRREES